MRKTFIEKAKRNIERFLGFVPENHEIHPEDIARARLEPESFDRVPRSSDTNRRFTRGHIGIASGWHPGFAESHGHPGALDGGLDTGE